MNSRKIQEPNTCGHGRSDSGRWQKHRILSEDTMTRLALKYDTSIGQICRVNRMHWQDVLQTRHFIWVPSQECNRINRKRSIAMPPKSSANLPLPLVRAAPLPKPGPLQGPARQWLNVSPRQWCNKTVVSSVLPSSRAVPRDSSLPLPPHFYRQSIPNPNMHAGDGDPLLITTNIKYSDLLPYSK
ncbi:hypothetical protein KR018_007354 [Drosophila ironensis]|nr:hypothetical protein KR018_007354 [Drosophila ironensis]